MQLLWPLPVENTRITSRHGELVFGKPHVGIDISAITGTPVYAAHDGIVRYQWTDAGGYCIRLKGQECYTRYCHLHSYIADDDEYVRAGDEIARSGNTGSATTATALSSSFMSGASPRKKMCTS